MRVKISIMNVCLFLCGFLLIAGCDETFQPLQENDIYHFSIYGYLDAAADTQWVRVGPARQDINESPDPTGIKVTLEHLQSGEVVLMTDSLSSSKSFLNYWTTMDIEHEQTYRLFVEDATGKASQVTVTTPKELPPIHIIISRAATPSGISIATDIFIDDSVEYIADLQSVWYVIINPETENQRRIYRFPLRNTLSYNHAFFGTYYTFNIWDNELAHIERSEGGAEVVVVSKQIFAAAGGPEWDDSLSSIDDLEYFLPETSSNVENGLGYVVGISSGWYRQATCMKPDGSNFAPCKPEKPFW